MNLQLIAKLIIESLIYVFEIILFEYFYFIAKH